MIHAKVGDHFQCVGHCGPRFSRTKRGDAARHNRLELVDGDLFYCVKEYHTNDRKFRTYDGQTFFSSSGVLSSWRRLSPLELLAMAANPDHLPEEE
jgi:hypothetical protein